MLKKSVLVLLVAFSMFMSASVGAAEKKKMTVIMKSSEMEFWQIVIAGAKAAGKDFDIKITAQGPVAESDIDKQIGLVENAITTKPDALVLAPSVSDSLVPAIERAAQKGIPVIIIDNKPNTDKYLSFLASDSKKIGALAADKLAAAIKRRHGKAEGKVAGIEFISGANVLINRREGFEKRMAEKYPDIEIIDFRDAQGKSGVSINIAQDYLTAYPDLRGLYCSNQTTGDETVRALDMSERKDIALAVVDSGPNEIWGVENGYVDAMIVQKPFMMGYLGVKYALDAVNGKEVPKVVDTGIVSISKEMIEDGSAEEFLDPIAYFSTHKVK